MKLNDLFVRKQDRLVDALHVLDSTGKGIVFVVEDDNLLVGTLTDGDVRRCILKTGNLEAVVGQAVNVNPFIASIEESVSLPAGLAYDAVPIVDGEGAIVDAVFRDGDTLQRNNAGSFELPVVMMAGGLGTRLYPYTKILPKPLIPVNDVPIAERIIERFRGYGSRRFILIVNHKKEMIKAYFNDLPKDYFVEFVEEDEFLGTGGGLSLLKGMLDSTFVLTNCDILIEADMGEALKLHEQQRNAVTIFASLKSFAIPYGSIEIGEGGEIANMVEKPEIPLLVNTGCYIVEPSVFAHIDEDEQIGFPDIIERCREAGENVGVYPISDKSWLDMGQLDGLQSMSQRLNADLL